MTMRSPAHPGAILREWMGDALTVSALARHLGISRANMSMILNGRLGITASTAVKLSEAFPKTGAAFWMNLQSQYDVAKVLRLKRKKIKPIRLELSAAA